MKVGKRRIHLDPLSLKAISESSTRRKIRSLIKKGAIKKIAVAVHSRANVRIRNEAKAKGRHTGMGKRRGTRNARLPMKVLWMRRQRVLRRLLKKYREKKKD